MKQKLLLVLLCLALLAVPTFALAEGLEIEYDEVPAVMAVEAPSAEDAEIVAEAAEPAVDEAGEFLLDADEGDAPAKADGQSVMPVSDDFEIDEDGVLTGYNGPGGAIVIPAEATVIGYEAFEGVTTISSVVIHDGVTKIDDYAFNKCSNLASVTFGNGLRSIGYRAFRGTALSEVTFPNSLIGIGEEAFWDCALLTKITFNNGLTSIDRLAFRECKSLTSVVLPDSLGGISEGVFESCSNLKSATLPKGLTSIGPFAFANCTALAVVNVPDGVTSIGEAAFNSCAALTAIDLPDSVVTIGNAAFAYSGLKSIVLPAKVVTISEACFRSCAALTEVKLSSGLTSIGNEAFRECTALTAIDLPADLTSVSPYLFYDCKNLAGIKLPAGVKKIGESAFDGTGLTAVEVPDGTIGIDKDAFSNCYSLKSIFIPASVQTMDDDAIRNYEGYYSEKNNDVVIRTPCGSYAQEWANEREIKTEIDPHKNVVTDPYVAPTATTPGKTEGSHCAACGDVIVAQQNIFATGAIKVNGANVTYDGERHGIEVTVSNPSDVTVRYGTKAGSCDDYDSAEYVDAGAYTIYYKVEAENYVTVETSATLTIAPKTVGLKWSNLSFTYDGKSHKPKATATGLVDDDVCKVTVSGPQTNAGSHTATASKLSNKNYALPKKATKAFTIAPKTVGLKWTKTKLTYNGKSQKPTATATGLIEGDKCTVTVGGARKAAGKGTAKATKLSNANYALPEKVTQAFTIAKKTVGLKWTKTTLTYNGKAQKPTATATGLIKGDKCTVTVSGARKSAGKGKATATKLSNANYKLPKTVTKAFTINKKTVGLDWTNLEFEYDGKLHKPTAKATNIVKGDKCTVTVTGARKAVGTGTAKAAKLSNTNYKLPKDNSIEFEIVE